MTLADLEKQVNLMVERAFEFGALTCNVKISLQIENAGFNSGSTICADESIELHYDNNVNTSGCVIVGHPGSIVDS